MSWRKSFKSGLQRSQKSLVAMLLALLNSLFVVGTISLLVHLGVKYRKWTKVGVERKYGVYAQGGEKVRLFQAVDAV